MADCASRPSPVARALRALVEDGPVKLTVSGVSMAPVLEDGAPAALAPFRLPLPGDILVYQDERGRLVAHRFLGPYVRRRRMWLLLKGDAAPGPDQRVAPEAVVGRLLTGVSLRERWRAVIEYGRHAAGRRAVA